MSIAYDPAFDWKTNIDDLASKLESVLRERTKTRETILPYPSTNVASILEENANALANFDRETQIIRYQASAARDGYLWFDQDSLRVPTVALDAEARMAQAGRKARQDRSAGGISRVPSHSDTSTASHGSPRRHTGTGRTVLWK